MSMKAENNSKQLNSTINEEGNGSYTENAVVTNDSDCYSDSNISDDIEKNFSSVFYLQGDIVRQASDEFKTALVQYQKDLLAAVSSAERSEAIRQARELELTRVNLLNKKLCDTCKQQKELLTDLQDQIRIANEKNDTMVGNITSQFEAEKNRLSAEGNVLQEQLKVKTEQVEILQSCLNETQARLDVSMKNEEQLHSTIDRLTRELAHATEEKMKTSLLMESELNDATVLKLNHDELVHQYENLRDRFERTEHRLIMLRSGLPSIVRQAVLRAVEIVQTAAAVQLESANDRLDQTEERLGQQLKRLRALEIDQALHPHSTIRSTPKVDQDMNSQSLDDTTDTTRPTLKPRSRTMLEWDTGRNDGATSSKPEYKSDLSANVKQSYCQTAATELDQRRLYNKLCRILWLLEGDSQTAGTQPQARDASSSLTQSDRAKPASKDTCVPAKLRLKVPTPPWRATSKHSQVICTLNATKSSMLNGQGGKRMGLTKTDRSLDHLDNRVVSDTKISDDEGRPKDNGDLWSKIGIAVNELYELLKCRGDSTTQSENPLNQRLKTLELENQNLQKKLEQYHIKRSRLKCSADTVKTCPYPAEGGSQMDKREKTETAEMEDRTGGHAIQGRKDQRNCPVPKPTTHRCCRSSERLQELEARCFRALSEAGRWRRRWQEQEGQLKLERERISMMKINQQADLQIREHFLYSVCKLVQEASRQIDHIVRKTTASGLLRPAQMTASHWCTPDRVNVATHAHRSSTRVPRADQHTRRSLDRPEDYSLSRTDHKHSEWNGQFGSTTAHGDGRILSCESLPDQTLLASRGGQTSPDDIESFPHTNCNNNEIATGSASDRKIATEMESNGFHQESGNKLHPTQDGSLFPERNSMQYKLLMQGSPVPGHRSALCEVRSTSATSESLSIEEENVQNPKSPTTEHDGTAPNSLLQVIGADGAVSETSISASSCFVPTNGCSGENPERWTELREAVRYELSRVLANVIAQAKQDNSLAQECLEAISDLQAQLDNEPVATANPAELSIPQPEVPSQSIAAAGEGKRPTTTSSRRSFSGAHRIRHQNGLNEGRARVAMPVDQSTKPGSVHVSKQAPESSADGNVVDSHSHPNRPKLVTETTESETAVHSKLTIQNVTSCDVSKEAPNRVSEKKCAGQSTVKPQWRPVGKVVQYTSQKSNYPMKLNRLRGTIPRQPKPVESGTKDQLPKSIDGSQVPSKEEVCTSVIVTSDDAVPQTNLNASDNYYELERCEDSSCLTMEPRFGLSKPIPNGNIQDESHLYCSSLAAECDPFGIADNRRSRGPRNPTQSVTDLRESIAVFGSELVEQNRDVFSGAEYLKSPVSAHSGTHSPTLRPRSTRATLPHHPHTISHQTCVSDKLHSLPVERAATNANTVPTVSPDALVNTTSTSSMKTTKMLFAQDPCSDHSKSSSHPDASSNSPVLWISEIDQYTDAVDLIPQPRDPESMGVCCCGTACCTIDADGL